MSIQAQEQLDEQQIAIAKELAGTVFLRPGQRLWGADLSQTNPEIVEVEINRKTVEIGADRRTHLKVDMKPGWLYSVAINKKNALKKMTKHLEKISHAQNER